MSFWSHQSPVFAWKNQVNTSSQVRWLDDVFSGCLPPQKKSPSNIQIISMKKKCHTYLIFSGLPPSPSQKKVALGSACAWKCRLAFLTSLKMVSLVLETNKHRQPKKRNLSQQVKTNSPQTESGSIFGGESRPNKSWLKKKCPIKASKQSFKNAPIHNQLWNWNWVISCCTSRISLAVFFVERTRQLLSVAPPPVSSS